MSVAIDESLRPILCAYNPFDDVARPQHADGRFSQVHVPAVLRAPREQLLAAIDAYRVRRFSALVDLPASRVIKVLGHRGAGKTHLYEAVLHREDGAPQLLISRDTENFDEGMPFEEYMFQLLMAALNGQHPVYGYRFFDVLAAQVTRRLLLHTVRELGPTDRMFVQCPSRWRQFRLLWRGGEESRDRFDTFAAELQPPAAAAELRRVCERQQMSPELLADLVLARLSRLEPGDSTQSCIRRELYGAMIRAALLQDRDALQGFLEADYQAGSRARVLHRADVVRQLLHAVREVCALVQLPVVYVFDNMEGLLAPAGYLQPRRAAAFLEGLAQAVDHTRGFLFLVLFEQGLYSQALMHAGTFARSRLDLGVHVPGHCRVAELELQPPTRAELSDLVQGRMAGLRSQLPGGNSVPAHFPFAPQFLEELGQLSGMPIRGRIERLRDEYNRIVFGRCDLVAAPVDVPGPNEVTREELERIWEDALLEAGRSLEVAWTDQQVNLTRGLSQLLQAALPWPEYLPQLDAACQALPIGDNPRHGFATLVRCTQPPARVAIGFLLATGAGMPLDMRAKFAAFSDEKTRANWLIILWPTGKSGGDLVAALPTKTREVWEECCQQRAVCLRAVDRVSLRKIRALPLFLENARKQDISLSDDLLRSFVRERCVEVFPLVIPDPQVTEHGN
ncbi:MAG: hypothetical protein GXY58_18070 [Planctomycetaceae bacterium]|nr:hypothetical protein [Planctomycetaceae bacterium]